MSVKFKLDDTQKHARKGAFLRIQTEHQCFP